MSPSAPCGVAGGGNELPQWEQRSAVSGWSVVQMGQARAMSRSVAAATLREPVLSEAYPDYGNRWNQCRESAPPISRKTAAAAAKAAVTSWGSWT